MPKNRAQTLPPRPVERLTRPLEEFLHMQAAGGVVLFLATVVALVLANSPIAEPYRNLWNAEFSIGVPGFMLTYPLWYWVNDGLMAIFFFVIGLEIKRELVWGELRDKRNVILPAAGALGGIVVPVGIFLLLQSEPPNSRGWAVPMATDIAFVVGCIALLGPRIPAGLKVFLLSLAIIDDIVAVLVIAVVFTGELSWVWLLCAALGFGVTTLLNRIGVRRVAVYVFVGALIWLCTLKSGVHPTVAGALLGLLTPASAWLGNTALGDMVANALNHIKPHAHAEAARSEAVQTAPSPAQDSSPLAPDPKRREAVQDLAFAASESVSPLERLEHALHPWVGFAIMPLFALANAGIAIDMAGLTHPIASAIAAGLVIGKPLGIGLATWLVVRLGLASLPHGTSFSALLGGAALAGIGFTMALFIASLSLEGDLLEASKSGILLGSALSMAIGLALLRWFSPRPPTTPTLREPTVGGSNRT